MLLMIDNYDSFTYNLAQGFGMLGLQIKVFRNDKITLEEIEKINPAQIVISPGPGTPKQAGISKDVIRHFAGKKDILGVCLGHQCIGEVYGANVVHAQELMHGKTSSIFHKNVSIFQGQPNPFEGARYHSLALSPTNFPKCLQIIATTENGAIMGIRHREQRVVGLQIHPESFLTQMGQHLLSNFAGGHL